MSTPPIDWLKKFIDAGEAPGKASPRRIGRYEVVSEIGRGGSSIIYKATDPDLKRTVALKVLRDAVHPELLSRLHREATAAARLRHPNIVPIHEVGTILEADGDALHFIAMDYVEGRNLAEAAAGMTPVERLEVLHSVAQTAAFAHEQGIVHRDLKPENILVEPIPRVDPSGLRWRVWLTDFGLAKIIGGEDLTRSGMVFGTPHYMSPEQVRGRARETVPATDVWALGVMLYECLTGRRPFDGQTALEIYEQIVHAEPSAPRKGNPHVSADFDTLVLKALEKEPSARYPDARAFAADLERCIREEPISTRPAGVARKSWRRVRKNPLPYALGAGMAIIFVIAVSLAVLGRAERQESLLAFRDKARIALDAALALRRAGANARMREFLPPLEEAYRQASSRAPDLAEIDYLIGRMHRALLEDDRALEDQEAALRKDPQYGPALYERAVLNFKKYVLEAERSPAPGDEGDRTKPEIAGLRESIVRDCSTVLARPQDGLTPANILVVRGMLEYGRGRLSEARGLLEEAARADPLLDEVWLILGRMARLGATPGFEERDRKYRAEEESYTQGLLRDQGFVPYLFRRGQLRMSRGHYYAEHGRDPSPDFAAAEKDLSQALEKDPSSFEIRLRRANNWMFRGVYERPPISDPLEDFARAEADLVELTLRPPTPQTPSVWISLASVRLHRGKHLLGQGRDPVPDFASAQAALEKSMQSARKDYDASGTHANLGLLFSTWAAHLWKTNRDPIDLFKKAEEHFAAALKVHPRDHWYHRLRATCLVSRAEYRESRSEDPFPDYVLAEDDLQRAIELRSDFTSAWRERAQLRFGRGAAWEKRGEKERARMDYSASANDYLQTLSLNALLKPELEPRLADAQRKAAQLGQ
jgi:tetratricopeptide (TPR) repeat protein/tRNA A-37 threonylcarbamoyl transferase component Bud32